MSSTANHELITRDLATNQTSEQNPNHVNDHGAAGSGHQPPGNAGELEARLLAKAFGIHVKQNPDGSFDVKDPLSDPQGAATSILKTVFDGLLGGGDSKTMPFGMNPLLAAPGRAGAIQRQLQSQNQSRRLLPTARPELEA